MGTTLKVDGLELTSKQVKQLVEQLRFGEIEDGVMGLVMPDGEILKEYWDEVEPMYEFCRTQGRVEALEAVERGLKPLAELKKQPGWHFEEHHGGAL